ncbi:MAG: uracil-DNA glycosylase family protein, partial [Erysipelothrix sp.]|nr:uracil-DNA glycosylase family protein [Erysipelothrix sp.]
TREENDVFRDVSGDRLREWLGIDEETFYTPQNFAVLPMDFYFPGKGKTGDLPPRKDFASRWHPLLLNEMKQIQLIILVGSYAQKYYLKDNMKSNLTQTVKSFGEYLPKYFPLVHPSPLNRRWEAKNPWFNEEVLPVLKHRVHKILEGEIKR